jgi:3-isopropylmalate/(R)-2-methylmalate dehydratase small subunit
MEKFTIHEGRALPLRRSNVDTDQIIPARYLKRLTRHGFEDGLFSAWRTDPTFILNDPKFAGVSVLIVGPDFGTGSSREHAVWALQDYGFVVVFSSRFADIFRSNAGKSGMPAGVLPQSVIEQIWDLIDADPTTIVRVDLQTKQIKVGDLVAEFEIDDEVRWRLLEGLDEIGTSMMQDKAITEFEAKRSNLFPTTEAAKAG